MTEKGDNQPVKITRGFAKKLAGLTRKGGSLGTGDSPDKSSSLYSFVRQAEITGENWQSGLNSLWYCKAKILINGNPVSPEQLVYYRASPEEAENDNFTPPFSPGDRMTIIWRGRWEILTGSGTNLCILGPVYSQNGLLYAVEYCVTCNKIGPTENITMFRLGMNEVLPSGEE